MTEQTIEHDETAGTHGYISDKDQYLRRLRRIEGQARGLQNKVEDELTPVDLLGLAEHLIDVGADVLSISVDGFAAVARGVHVVAALLNEERRREGLTILQSNGAEAWQDVDHLHVHVIPRSAADALVPPWTSSPSGAAEGIPH